MLHNLQTKFVPPVSSINGGVFLSYCLGDMAKLVSEMLPFLCAILSLVYLGLFYNFLSTYVWSATQLT